MRTNSKCHGTHEAFNKVAAALVVCGKVAAVKHDGRRHEYNSALQGTATVV